MLSAPENSQCHIMKLHSLLYLLPISLSYTNLSGTISPNFNITVPLKIIVHGFGSSCYRVWTREMRLSLLAVVRQILIRRNTRVSVAYSRIFFKPHGYACCMIYWSFISFDKLYKQGRKPRIVTIRLLYLNHSYPMPAFQKHFWHNYFVQRTLLILTWSMSEY